MPFYAHKMQFFVHKLLIFAQMIHFREECIVILFWCQIQGPVPAF